MSAGYFRSCRFITIMHTCLKVPAKNSPALLFLSRGKEEERKTTTISCFAPAEEEQSRGILGGNFQTRMHDGNKAAAHKGTTWTTWIEKRIKIEQKYSSLVNLPGAKLLLLLLMCTAAAQYPQSNWPFQPGQAWFCLSVVVVWSAKIFKCLQQCFMSKN